MKQINTKELYEKWTAGEWDNPFSKDNTWRGDMVEGFVKFCIKESLSNTQAPSKDGGA